LIGRRGDLLNLINTTCKQKVTILEGEEGVGKTALAVSMAWYLRTRATSIFRGGIYYINLKAYRKIKIGMKEFLETCLGPALRIES
jgi:ABC-type branched-subunit amino acid transport system ATPase component